MKTARNKAAKILESDVMTSKVRLLKLRSRVKKFGGLLFKKKFVHLMAMGAIFFGALASNEVAMAGSVGGFGGATEITQLLNNVQLVSSYAKQIDQYVMQGMQYDAQLKNLMRNPASSMGSEAAQIINGIGGIMSAGQAIGGTLSQIDKNFSAKFNSPTAASFSGRFSDWTSTSKDTLQGALKSAGMRRDQYSSDSSALSALYSESQNTEGNMAALQTLAKINIEQVKQLHALGDLMATQNIAANTYMATQLSKDSDLEKNNIKVMGNGENPRPKKNNSNNMNSN